MRRELIPNISKEYESLNVLNGDPDVRQWADRASISEYSNPTAIIIKNIPFAVQRKHLEVIHKTGLPLPQALYYLFTGGLFMGLALAHFATPEEMSLVINALNHIDVYRWKTEGRIPEKKLIYDEARQILPGGQRAQNQPRRLSDSRIWPKSST
jgi:hypothetical protein